MNSRRRPSEWTSVQHTTDNLAARDETAPHVQPDNVWGRMGYIEHRGGTAQDIHGRLYLHGVPPCLLGLPRLLVRRASKTAWIHKSE